MTRADDAFQLLAERWPGKAQRGVPLAPFTSYQLGGPAAVYVEPDTQEDLAAIASVLHEVPLPLLVLGRGSNMLVSDRGFDGLAVRLGAGFRWARVEQDSLRAGASMPVPAMAALAGRHRLAGFEFAVAIPASFGGAIAMNAGAHRHSVSEVLAEATLFDLSSGASRVLPASGLGFAYRTSRLPPRTLVIGGVLSLRSGTPQEIESAMHEARAWRKATQPIGLPNAGSVFKNPEQESAGSLVERYVGKGTSVGGARVSEVHANFIVTRPGATALDVYSLLRQIQRRVADNSGVALETEVKLVGEFPE